MTIQTRSSFWYVEDINDLNFRLDIDEGGGELTAEISVGSYSPEQLKTAVETALNNLGGLEYTVTLDRSTRKLTISSTSNFDLLIFSGGSSGTSAYPLLGFSGSDKTGSSSYESDSSFGTLYRPQAPLQDYVDFEDYREAVSASVNESTSGIIETITFGSRSFMEAKIKWANDRVRSKDHPIEGNTNAVQELRDFLNFITLKGSFEFIEDRDNPAVFDTVILESTPQSSDGTGYKLKEMSGRNLYDFYETGKLKFRRVT